MQLEISVTFHWLEEERNRNEGIEVFVSRTFGSDAQNAFIIKHGEGGTAVAEINHKAGTRWPTACLDLWAYANNITLDFSRSGKPTDNGFIEAFNSKRRAECLNAHWFLTLADACKIWSIGAETTTSSGRTARSDTKCRLSSIITVA